MNYPEVITLGETMVVMNPDQSLPLEYNNTFSKQIGGAESNVAIGLSRLGHSAGWISKLGKDPFGYFIKQVIQGEGVDMTYTAFDEEAPTGIFFKERKFGNKVNVYYYRSHSAASRLTKDDVSEEYVKNAKYVLISGITSALSESCAGANEKLIEIAEKYHIPIVFDPNLRLKLWKEKQQAIDTLQTIAQRSDIILTGQWEAYQLTGYDQPEDIAAYYAKNAPGSTVIVKLGEQGAYYSQAGDSGYVKGFPVTQVVDPIGAGDSFAAGFISALLNGKSIREAIKKGNAAGAITVQVAGDIEGFPRPEEVERLLQDQKSSTKENRIQEEVDR